MRLSALAQGQPHPYPEPYPEPLPQVYHILRTLGFGSNGKGYLHDIVTAGSIGQQHMKAPTVFNFYDPLYQPPGAVAEVQLSRP